MRLIALLLLGLQGLLATASHTPVFSDNYVARGRILLPYAEIDEPFTAYFDARARKSRIDYYGDLVQTVQRADLHQLYKLSYFVNDQGETARVCFKLAGSSYSPPQSVLPDLRHFTLKAKGACRQLSNRVQTDGDCEAWEYRVTNGQKASRYLFILRRDTEGEPIPVYYLMMGTNTLMGSHYDKYEIHYESYSTGTIDHNVFDIYKTFRCREDSEGGPERLALMNPIREFIHGQTEHIDEGWRHFQAKHNKTYEDAETHYRENLFRQNYRFIASHNRQSTTYQVAINHLADRSDAERRALRGRQARDGPFYNGGLFFDKTKYNRHELPSQLDWRLLGAVNPVRDQAICGSCWAFGTVGTIEGAYFVKTGRLPVLSEQQLVDCSWPETNNGCEGGNDYKAYEYIQKVGGISTEEDYGSYLGMEGKCHDKEVKKTIKVTGFYNITQDDAESLKVALYNHGPVTVSIDASRKSFDFYSHGVYSDPSCSSTELDHSVLAVGYGDINGHKYWLIKNSWSTYYGADGYLLISQNHNTCGVLTDATFPIVE